MIYSIEGSLTNLRKFDGFFMAVVKTKSGVSYSIKVSLKTAESVADEKEINLFTELILRENLIELFGFFKEEERECFKLLVGVSGVGPSFAISILSFLTPYELFRCVSLKDYEKLCQCKGIGKKTASRIVLELKDRIKCFEFEKEEDLIEDDLKNSAIEEAIEALVVLGYGKTDAQRAVMNQKEKKAVEAIVKEALLTLSDK